MKLQLIISTFFIGLASAGKISTTKYLPPNSPDSSRAHAGLLHGSIASSDYVANLHFGSNGQSSTHGINKGVQYAGIPVHTALHTAVVSQIPILRSNYANDGNGNYNFDFVTGNGIRRGESGVLNGNTLEGSQSVKGSYSYTGDDGQVYSVSYEADDSGFHAVGDHLPTPPPVPKEIQESLLVLQDTNLISSHSYGNSAIVSNDNSPSPSYLPPHQQDYYGRQ